MRSSVGRDTQKWKRGQVETRRGEDNANDEAELAHFRAER